MQTAPSRSDWQRHFLGATAVAGDLNFDGAIDALDWPLYAAGLGRDLSGLTMAEAFQMGDMDSDFDNDYADFLLFREAYETANGPGSFALLVPEPHTVGMWGPLFMLTLAHFLRRPPVGLI